MAYVILEGTGTYQVYDYKFVAGANECDDERVLEAVKAEGLDWLTVQDDRKPVRDEAPAAPEPEPTPPAPYDTFQGRDGKWYFLKPAGEGSTTEQDGPFDTEEDVDKAVFDAKAADEEIPLAGTVEEKHETGVLQKEDLEPKDYPCEVEGCTRVFKSSGARTNHERLKHPKTKAEDES